MAIVQIYQDSKFKIFLRNLDTPLATCSSGHYEDERGHQLGTKIYVSYTNTYDSITLQLKDRTEGIEHKPKIKIYWVTSCDRTLIYDGTNDN